MLPYIERQVSVLHDWLNAEEFLDLLAIAQSTPGPIAINSSTFVGFQTGGVAGAMVASFGVIFFAIFAINLLAAFLERNVESPRIKQLFLTLRPITVGLILAAAFTTGSKVLVDLAFHCDCSGGFCGLKQVAFASYYLGIGIRHNWRNSLCFALKNPTG